MVFAAGLGTRLKPLTDTMPKALVPICGQPLLYHVLTKLTKAGYHDIVVNVHHFPEQIRNYLAITPFDANIRISDESGLLRETGGALRYAAPLLGYAGSREAQGTQQTVGGAGVSEANGVSPTPEHPVTSTTPEPVLVHNVDILSDLDLEWLRAQHREGALATLLVSERRTQRYFLFDEEMRLVGWTNIATGEVRSPYGAIDPEKYRKLAFSGIHLLSPAVFPLMETWPERFPIVDLYLKTCAEHPIYGAVPEKLQMVDVGKMETLSQAERVAEAILSEKN